MAEITLQIPDELAKRLQPLEQQLPELLWQLVETNITLTEPNPNILDVYQEVLDFLLQRPTPEEIANFKVSSPTQERLSTLLFKNSQGLITPTEVAELDVYEQLEHLMLLLKVRALSKN